METPSSMTKTYKILKKFHVSRETWFPILQGRFLYEKLMRRLFPCYDHNNKKIAKMLINSYSKSSLTCTKGSYL